MCPEEQVWEPEHANPLKASKLFSQRQLGEVSSHVGLLGHEVDPVVHARDESERECGSADIPVVPSGFP